jgi:hypothetical protein
MTPPAVLVHVAAQEVRDDGVDYIEYIEHAVEQSAGQ